MSPAIWSPENDNAAMAWQSFASAHKHTLDDYLSTIHPVESANNASEKRVCVERKLHGRAWLRRRCDYGYVNELRCTDVDTSSCGDVLIA